MDLKLDTPVQFLKGVGPRRAEAFARLGVHTVEDLLYHIPHRYLDATTITPIARASVGNDVTIVGNVVSTGVIPTRRLKIFRAVIQDKTGVIECSWPGQPFMDRVIKSGQMLLVSGPVKFFHGRQVVPREQVVLAEDNGDEGLGRGMVLPVYPATEGLSHRRIRKLIAEHLDSAVTVVEESLPPKVLKVANVLGIREAFLATHRPRSVDEAERGRRRLAFDELLDLQLVVTRARHIAKSIPKGPRFINKRDLTTKLKESLPFTLTSDQKKCVREITADMISDSRMHRLLMGDVGSGKTVVALFAILIAVENGYQAVFMAPTELLAEQHGESIGELLAPLGIQPELLIGQVPPRKKREVRRRIATGETRVVIGTHALIQQDTEFARLGVTVIDEQHRFGVEQRASLVAKGDSPDVLLLSATPIPRSLALTVYGDLDISVLREKPAGRGAISAAVNSPRQRGSVYDLIMKECTGGRQAYVVYPVIEESERTDLRAARTMAAELKRTLSSLVVDLVHGRMKQDERESVMRRFRDGEIQVLVATTVIEVGIDVANATVMVIEHPERFGLAQLHQLRGRVGRGAEQSYCILLASDSSAVSRLKRFAAMDDGFEIAELDLKERGMGDLAGARQSGGLALRYTDLSKDVDLLSAAREAATDILSADPELATSSHDKLRHRIERRYDRGLTLFRMG
ncbi:MAG: ATP-dependent DNA helicase RecG [Gemmatimonadales bacterium]